VKGERGKIKDEKGTLKGKERQKNKNREGKGRGNLFTQGSGRGGELNQREGEGCNRGEYRSLSWFEKTNMAECISNL
jgi:hypothetical protein